MKRKCNFLEELVIEKRSKKCDVTAKDVKPAESQASVEVIDLDAASTTVNLDTQELESLITQPIIFDDLDDSNKLCFNEPLQADIPVKNENWLVRGFTTKLNNCGSKLLHFGQNPHRDFIHECRIINPKKSQYLRMTFFELEYFVTMAKQSSLEMPFHISGSLIGTKKLFNKKEEMFLLERKCKVPDGCANEIYLGIKSLEQLRALFPVIKLTFEDTSETTEKDVEKFVIDIARQFEYRPPGFKEIMLWYTECDKINLPADRTMHDLRREMLLNFGELLVKSVKDYCYKVTSNNLWNFEDL